MFKRLIASLVCLTFSFSNLQYVHAQGFSVNQLPVPGTMVGVSSPFSPLALKGLIVNPQKPLEFQFIVDTGRGAQDTASVKEQANQLVKYFLAGLTIPEGDLWVNLSPYEKDRMVPEALGQTDLGRDLLAQDYILKQLTASLIYPEKSLGKEFWSRVYAKAQQQFGTTNIPVNTFNKVWILPNQAQVFENGNAAYVTKSTLKVMLDEDYLAKQKHQATKASSVSSEIVREIILPEIEKEVNTGKNFAPLRQIYQALILAKWYKETIQNGLLDAVYTNKNKVAGVNLNDPAIKEQIYQRYLKAYKKGAFNYIKEDPTPSGQSMPRQYFSGGTNFANYHLGRTNDSAMLSRQGWVAGAIFLVTVGLGATLKPALAQNDATVQTPPVQNQSAPTAKMSEEEFQREIGMLSDPNVDNVVGKMIAGIVDEDSETQSIIESLGNSGDKRAIDPILRALSKGVCISEADEALGRLGAPRESILLANVKAIRAHQGDYNFDLYHTPKAVNYLIAVNDKKTISLIINNPDPAFDYFEEKVLIALRANKEEFYQYYRGYFNSPYRIHTIRLLGSIGDKQAIEFLRSRLDNMSKEPQVESYSDVSDGDIRYKEREEAKDALRKLGAGWWDQQSDSERWWWIAKFSGAGLLVSVVGYKSRKNIKIKTLRLIGDAETLASILQEAENLKDHETYNIVSNELYKMGDPRGAYEYKHVQLEAEKGHEEIEYRDYNEYPHWVVDKPAVYEWIKERRAPQQDQDAAMLAKMQIAFWTRTGNVDKIVTMLDNGDESVRKAAMDTIDKKAVTLKKKLPILEQALSNQNNDVRLWGTKEKDRLMSEAMIEAGNGDVDKLANMLINGKGSVFQATRDVLKKPGVDIEIIYKVLERMENVESYDRANDLLDLLYKLGDRRKMYVYKSIWHEREFVQGPAGSMSYFHYDTIDVPAHYEWVKQERDSAMLQTPKVVLPKTAENGGIDLNQIKVNRAGKTVNVQFDQAQLNELMQGGFEGFTPVIINIKLIQNPLLLPGINSSGE